MFSFNDFQLFVIELISPFVASRNFNALLIETIPQGLTDPEFIEMIYKMENEMRMIGRGTFLGDGLVVVSVADELKKLNDAIDKNDIIDRFAEKFGVDTL